MILLTVGIASNAATEKNKGYIYIIQDYDEILYHSGGEESPSFTAPERRMVGFDTGWQSVFPFGYF